MTKMSKEFMLSKIEEDISSIINKINTYNERIATYEKVIDRVSVFDKKRMNDEIHNLKLEISEFESNMEVLNIRANILKDNSLTEDEVAILGSYFKINVVDEKVSSNTLLRCEQMNCKF